MLKNLLAKYNNFVQNASLKTFMKLYVLFFVVEIIQCLTHPDVLGACLYFSPLVTFIVIASPLYYLFFLNGFGGIGDQADFTVLFYLISIIAILLPNLFTLKNHQKQKIIYRVSYGYKFIFWIYLFLSLIFNCLILINNDCGTYCFH